jgi:hypothetical protein
MQNIDFAHRIEKVRAGMEAQGLDFLVATSRSVGDNAS